MSAMKLANVQCKTIRFQPGDRVLVEVYQALDKEQEAKLKKTVERWAGKDVEVLIVNRAAMRVYIDG